MTQIRLMLFGMLHAHHNINHKDMVESIMSAINSILEAEIKRKQPNIRKFHNLPDSRIILDQEFWRILAEGNKVGIAKHLRKTNRAKDGYPLGLHECMVIIEALYPTV